jgi:hypothetical protein
MLDTGYWMPDLGWTEIKMMFKVQISSKPNSEGLKGLLFLSALSLEP